MMQKTDIVIRKAVVSDSGIIADIEKECFSSPWSVNQIAEEIVKENVVFLSAEINNVLCGYVSGQLILDEFYISNIAVTNAFRGRGVASLLLDKLINELQNKVCSFVTLEVRESNNSARRLYEKFGFSNLGIRKDFYSAPKENACIYTLYFEERTENI